MHPITVVGIVASSGEWRRRAPGTAGIPRRRDCRVSFEIQWTAYSSHISGTESGSRMMAKLNRPSSRVKPDWGN